VGGFSLDGAIATCGGQWGGHAAAEATLLELLTALVDKSLVLADQSGIVTRYRMLTATCQYAYEKLQANDEPDGMRRLAAYLVQVFERAEVSWETTPTSIWFAEFGPEIENLRAAIDWAFGQHRRTSMFDGREDKILELSANERIQHDGDPAIGIALVAAAGGMADEMSLLGDMKRWTAAALPHVSATTQKARAARVLQWATRHHAVFGVRELSEQRRRSIALFREAGDIRGLSGALRTAGLALARPGERCDEAYEMVLEAEAILRPFGPCKGLASALAHLGAYHYLAGDDEAARQASEAALDMRRALGDRTGELLSYINIAEFAFARGDTQSAVSYATQAQRAARACKLQEVLATVLTNLANYRLQIDDLAGARGAALEALALHRVLGNDDYSTVCLEHMALAHVLGGAPHHAARLFGYTDAYFRNTGQVRDRAEELSCTRLRRMLEATIPPARLEQLMREGADWPPDQAHAAAMPPPVHLPPRALEAGGRLALGGS
jgi:tetratricopeptide (TPR) repeat protein